MASRLGREGFSAAHVTLKCSKGHEKDIVGKNSSAIGVLQGTRQEMSFRQHLDDVPSNAGLRLRE